MKDIFLLSKLLIKEKLRILSDRERHDLTSLREKYPWARDMDYGKISQKITYYDTINQDRAWETLQKGRTNDRESTPIVPRKWLAYAAMFIGLFATSVFLYLEFSKPNAVISDQQSEITLQLENGELKTITDSTQQQILNSNGEQIGIQKGNQLYYNTTDDVGELVFNELSVPNGKRFELVLSDGTHIYLNSGTSIKYPVKFIEGQNREVYLKGEGYFDVARDSLHPFVVNTTDIEVEVLGTEFNISSYPGDTNTN
ncbi:MAG: FecR family protein, partial [Flavobacteriaceae bacterium]